MLLFWAGLELILFLKYSYSVAAASSAPKR